MLLLQNAAQLEKPGGQCLQLQNCETLIKQVAGGDAVAFAQLYDATSGFIFSLLLRILRDSKTAEKVLESVYAEFWLEAVGFNAEREKPLTWLINITRRQGIEHLLLNRQSKILETSNGENYLPPVNNSNSSISEQQKLVCSALESIPAAQLEVLELAYFSGMKEGEIAVHLGQPVKTVRENLYLGMKNLHTLLTLVSL